MKLLQILWLVVCPVVVAVFLQYAVRCFMPAVFLLLSVILFAAFSAAGSFPEILLFIQKRE
ncbi:MAG: hypothetical protein GX424_05880 [Clostridiales bacterium]|jgi:hypothetical protein|nr:hypothetical protein [Clostridiales bacterium]